VADGVDESKAAAREELGHIDATGGSVTAVESGYMKQQLVISNTERLEAIERGERTVIGVNKYIESEPSPLSAGEEAVVTVPEAVEAGRGAGAGGWGDARGREGGGGRPAGIAPAGRGSREPQQG